MRRRIEEQGKRQDRFEVGLARLEQSVTQQTNVQVVLQPNPQATDEKITRFTKDPYARFFTLEDLARLRRPSEREIALRQEVIEVWTELEPYLSMAEILDTGLPLDLEEGQRQLLERWRLLFDEEIRFVQGARNTVVHGRRRVSEETLREARDTARKLLHLIQSQLGWKTAGRER